MTSLSADAFWGHCLALYSEVGVAGLCLKAQDEWGADVNILLLCNWLTSQGKSLNQQGWDGLLPVSKDLQRTILKPLRKKRYAAKGNDGYENLKVKELKAEQAAQAKYLETISIHTISLSKQNDPLHHYLKFLSIEDTGFRRALMGALGPT